MRPPPRPNQKPPKWPPLSLQQPHLKRRPTQIESNTINNHTLSSLGATLQHLQTIPNRERRSKRQSTTCMDRVVRGRSSERKRAKRSGVSFRAPELMVPSGVFVWTLDELAIRLMCMQDFIDCYLNQLSNTNSNNLNIKLCSCHPSKLLSVLTHLLHDPGNKFGNSSVDTWQQGFATLDSV